MMTHLRSIEVIKGSLDKNLPGCGQLSPGTSSSPTQLLSKPTVNNLNAKVSSVTGWERIQRSAEWPGERKKVRTTLYCGGKRGAYLASASCSRWCPVCRS